MSRTPRAKGEGAGKLPPGHITPHFKWSEFASRCGAPTPTELKPNIREVARRLELLRARLGNVPIIVLSGYRSPAHNRAVGGVRNSFHLRGMAADVRVRGFTPTQVAHAGREVGFTWYKIYETFTHLDIRGYTTPISDTVSSRRQDSDEITHEPGSTPDPGYRPPDTMPVAWRDILGGIADKLEEGTRELKDFVKKYSKA
ncbi:MAG: Zinc D-Ala-D-Ala carboxypeptidase [Syntrophomonadaceae bacterium]|nr:Zinc D-Ala-D-Ala carboxypeptidase [Bacillota bacterium]